MIIFIFGKFQIKINKRILEPGSFVAIFSLVILLIISLSIDVVKWAIVVLMKLLYFLLACQLFLQNEPCISWWGINKYFFQQLFSQHILQINLFVNHTGTMSHRCFNETSNLHLYLFHILKWQDRFWHSHMRNCIEWSELKR